MKPTHLRGQLPLWVVAILNDTPRIKDDIWPMIGLKEHLLDSYLSSMFHLNKRTSMGLEVDNRLLEWRSKELRKLLKLQLKGRM